jgi:putative pyruvate formate lyase activating enzyme
MTSHSFVPAYLRLTTEVLQEKVREAEGILKKCVLCPHECEVDRTAGEEGFCRTGDKLLVSSYGPHFGEEKPLVGRFGSGTIFFGSCNLACVFCQNYSISQGGEGVEMSCPELADIMLSLQNEGCHNINLVTPTHQMPLILRSLLIASEKGLSLPIVYNCGGYESMQSLGILDGIVDIYMPDFKYMDPASGLKYSGAVDYPGAAKDALKEMHRQVGDLLLDKYGIAFRGLLVRHLVLPGGLAGTKEFVKFIAEEISRNTYINIMDQYHPCHKAFGYPPLDRRISDQEYADAIQAAEDAGLTRIDGVTI